MELRDMLIPAHVLDFRVDNEAHHVMGMDGSSMRIDGRRHYKMEIELDVSNAEELNWLVQSLQENGSRISLIPAGSPIIHPNTLTKKALANPPKTDKPKEAGSLIW